jgi:hypothetical protein
MHRTRVAAKFLPHHKVDPHVTSVPAETVLLGPVGAAGVPVAIALAVVPAPGPALAPAQALSVDEGGFIRLIEISTEFTLTAAQVEEEAKMHKSHPAHAEHHELPETHTSHGAQSGPDHHHHHHHHHHPCSTAVTLARRAANFLSLVQDTVIFQGLNAFIAPAAAPAPPLGSGIFSRNLAQNRGTPLDTGLLCTAAPNLLPGPQIIPVSQSAPVGGNVVYSGNTVTAVNAAFALLAGGGYAGPYVTVLHFYPFADSLTPIPATLILPADRIKPLMEAGFYSSTTLPGVSVPLVNPAGGPQNPAARIPQAYGLVISLGGNTVDLVNGLDPITAFSQVDPLGNFTFRLLTRFALRIKDIGAIVRLEFA